MKKMKLAGLFMAVGLMSASVAFANQPSAGDIALSLNLLEVI
ncbi:hypothetical protein [Desulfurispira natronophila]|uniref:Uncharacterized protein n=1 Tax=Desulfurispira natronophila TaxID=682562 RepID=A0A7W7Y4Y8_9BACT|nr:hypothetical protein [Desulfurispira natronophila]MBB5022087.1 hypothetical protein [Desulfurispira natronophila]